MWLRRHGDRDRPGYKHVRLDRAVRLGSEHVAACVPTIAYPGQRHTTCGRSRQAIYPASSSTARASQSAMVQPRSNLPHLAAHPTTRRALGTSKHRKVDLTSATPPGVSSSRQMLPDLLPQTRERALLIEIGVHEASPMARSRRARSSSGPRARRSTRRSAWCRARFVPDRRGRAIRVPRGH